MQNKSNILLIIGCQRSGTTLLSALLGGHSEINMLFESTSKDVLRLIGKKYGGNKLLTWRQIRMYQRSSKFGFILNRIVNSDYKVKNKHHKIRIFPTSSMSIQDYIDKKATIITIIRDKDEVLNSIINRTKMNRQQAENEYDRAMEQIEAVKAIAINIDFADLINNTVDTLKAICNRLDLEFEPRMLMGTEYNFVYPHKSILKEKSSKFSSFK